MSNHEIDTMRTRLQITANRRTTLRGLAAGLLVAATAGRIAGAAQSATPEPLANFPGETFVGETSDPELLIAVVLAGAAGDAEREARAYLCSGTGISEWLLGTAPGETIELRNEAGAELRGEVTATEVSGTATLPDDTAVTFTAGPATGVAGLYTVTVAADHTVAGPSTAGGQLAGVVAERATTTQDGEGYLVAAILTPAEGEPASLLSLLDDVAEGSGRLIVLNEAAKARGSVRSVRRTQEDDGDGAINWRKVKSPELAEQ